MPTPRPTCQIRHALCLVAALLAGCGRPSEAPTVATLLPQARPLPAVTLQGSDGLPFLLTHLKGHPTLVFFGFTSCPDLCPTTLTTLAQARRQWEDLPSMQQPHILFVSVDPLRDTAATLAAYAQHFGPHVEAVTGDPATLQRLTAAFGALFALPQETDPSRSYSVTHSSQVYLLNRAGQFVAVFSPPHDADSIALDVRRIMILQGERP